MPGRLEAGRVSLVARSGFGARAYALSLASAFQGESGRCGSAIGLQAWGTKQSVSRSKARFGLPVALVCDAGVGRVEGSLQEANHVATGTYTLASGFGDAPSTPESTAVANGRGARSTEILPRYRLAWFSLRACGFAGSEPVLSGHTRCLSGQADSETWGPWLGGPAPHRSSSPQRGCGSRSHDAPDSQAERGGLPIGAPWVDHCMELMQP
jgi:hypothetical protein